MKLKIISKTMHPRDTEVELDGQLISKCITAVTINLDIHKASNEAILKLIPSAIEFDGEVAIFANIGDKKYKLMEEEN